MCSGGADTTVNNTRDSQFHRPTEQIWLGYFWDQILLGYRFDQGGPGPRPRSGAPPGTKHNQAKFAQLDDEITLVQMNLVTQQNMLGWTMKVSLVGGALAWGLDPRCPGQRADFVLWI